MRIATGLLLVLLATAATPTAGEEPPTVPALLDAFATGDAAGRREAADELGGRYPEGVVAVPLLIDGLDDDDPGVRKAAAKALDLLGARGLERYASVIGSEDDPVKPAFLRVLDAALGTLGTAQPTHMTGVMGRGQERPVRQGATLAAGLIPGTPSHAEPILDVLVDLLEDDEVAAEAAAALAVRGRDAVPGLPSAVAHALTLIRSGTPNARFAGARLLSLAGAEGKAVIAALGEALKHEPWPVQAAICDALGQLGPQAYAAAGALETVVRAEGKARFAAAKALLDVSATATLAALLRVEGEAGYAAAYALSFQRATIALPVLRSWFDIERRSSLPRDEVLRAMARMGPRLSETVPGLRGLLSRQLRSSIEAARTLLAIAPDDEKTLKLLCRVIEPRKKDRPHPMYFRAALDVLIELGPRAKPALPSLITILRYRDTGKDRAKGKALDRILFRTHDFDQVRRMQLRAIEIVRNLGAAAAEARPHLERQSRKPDVRLRYRAARALRALGPGG